MIGNDLFNFIFSKRSWIRNSDGHKWLNHFHSSQIWSAEEFHAGRQDWEFSLFMREALCDTLSHTKQPVDVCV